MQTRNFDELVDQIIGYVMKQKIRFLFISGNGASGKSFLAKSIKEKVEQQHGHVNTVDMDDFVVDTTLRKNSQMSWVDESGVEQKGRCSTSFKAAYFVQNVNAIVANISKGNDYYHWPKKATDIEQCIKLEGKAVLTIVEGIGSVFLNKNVPNAISIFMTCDKDTEIERRINRKQFSNEQSKEEIEKAFVERNSQFMANIMPYEKEAELSLVSNLDFSVTVIRDSLCILKNTK